MSNANYKEFPEILAMLTFLPAGVFMGHMMSFVQTTEYARDVFGDIKFWPYIVGGIIAMLTGGVHLAIKLKHKQYKYEHMYFQMVGLGFLLITGILLMTEELHAVAYLGFVGHGIIYVSALSYINIRTSKSKYRHLKLTMPHFIYLIGVSLGSTMVWTAHDFPLWISDNYIEWWRYSYYGMSTGTVLMITTCMIIGCFLINEVLQYSMRSYNYKESLDNDINRENTNKQIFENKYFHITPPHWNFPENAQLPHIPLKAESSGIKQTGFIVYALASKVLTLMYFYFPFIILHTSASVNSFDMNIFQLQWFGTAGIVISLIFMALLSFKINYFLSITVKVMFMVVLLIYFSYDYFYWQDMKILLWFLYIGLGFGFSHPDINILSFTNLKLNEITLGVSYFIGHLIIGVIQYETSFHPYNIFDDSSFFSLIFAHAITFILILVGLGVIGVFVLPNGKHTSLLEIKNVLNNCANINQLVNTGNYDGQQNPQLYLQQQIFLQQNYPQIAQIPPQVQPMPYDPNTSAYRPPPNSQNLFQYGRAQDQQYSVQQQYQHQPQPQYQQTPYINTTYPSQMGYAPGPYINHNLPPNYSQTENTSSLPPMATMPQQNVPNLPPNIAPIMHNAYTQPSQYEQNIARPVIPLTNKK